MLLFFLKSLVSFRCFPIPLLVAWWMRHWAIPFFGKTTGLKLIRSMFVGVGLLCPGTTTTATGSRIVWGMPITSCSSSGSSTSTSPSFIIITSLSSSAGVSLWDVCEWQTTQGLDPGMSANFPGEDNCIEVRFFKATDEFVKVHRVPEEGENHLPRCKCKASWAFPFLSCTCFFFSLQLIHAVCVWSAHSEPCVSEFVSLGS